MFMKGFGINNYIVQIRCTYLIMIAIQTVFYNIGEIHYHKENKTNGSKQIESSAESNEFEKNSKVRINEMFSNC